MEEPKVDPAWVADRIDSGRLRLSPLRPEDADTMADVLADERLHEFIGGRPADAAELQARYRRLVAGSSSPDEVWLNWIVRRREDAEPIGTVQATLVNRNGGWTAYVAWVIGVRWQGQGLASEAARALVQWLRRRGTVRVAANIHPDHRASEIVAARIGLRPTSEEVDGERVWRDGD